MAHFAQLDSNNVVVQVIVVNNDDTLDADGNESEDVGIAFCKSLFGEHTNWKQTSYSGSFRVRFAGIGYTYDPTRDAFISPRPYLSWVFNTETLDWDPPVAHPSGAYPSGDGVYNWNESTRTWDLVDAGDS